MQLAAAWPETRSGSTIMRALVKSLAAVIPKAGSFFSIASHAIILDLAFIIAIFISFEALALCYFFH
jgi:hypothetical protein